jgi:hypothetical protein
MNNIGITSQDDHETAFISRNRIKTIGDLFLCNNISVVDRDMHLRLCKRYIETYNIPITIKNHTWYGMQCHAYTDGRTIRATIQDLVVFRTHVIMRIKTHRTTMSIDPLLLLTIHNAWCKNDLISDNEDDNEDDEISSFNILPTLSVTRGSSLYMLDDHAVNILRITLHRTEQFMSIHRQYFEQ